MTRSLYELLAPYYDLLHEHLTDDVGFVLTLAAQSGGPALEIGCGTGRLLLPLARAGYSIVGLDNSPSMLERARQRLEGEKPAVRERVKLLETDATTFQLEERFPLILVPYNTFLHFNPSLAVEMCRAAAGHLADDGLLFLDLANPYLVEQTPDDHLLTLERVLTLPEQDEVVLVQAANHLAPSSQKLTITWVYDRSPRAGGPVERTVALVDYHYYYPHQVELILQESGLRLETFYGNYNQQPFTEESERLLVLARRA